MDRSIVEEIKARLPIEDVIGSYIKLDQNGKTFKAKCPFHNEKTASFFVSPERGGYYCFGCNAKGDIFTFVEQFEGLDFRGALKVLAERAGVTLAFDKKADGERDNMLSAMVEASRYFEDQYDKSSEAKQYIKSRGISDETRKLFKIGFAPEGWQNLHDFLKRKGYGEAILEKVGLIKKKEGGGFYDRFRGRIMFPILDSSGRVIAFSGRILPRLDDSKSAKYLNSPDTPLYDKSAVLYGLDKAKSEIRRLNYSILVEGQMDLVMSHQASIRNTVASSGTALSEDAFSQTGAISNLGLVRRLSSNIIIAFDSDSAGRKAAMRAAGIALSLGMDVKIADIQGGKDPADLVKEDINKWRETLKASKPIVMFELDNVVKETSDKRKLSKAVIDRVLPLVAKIGSSSDQSHFVQMISDKTKTPVDVIWQDLKVVEKRLKQNEKSVYEATSAKTSAERSKRVDLVERKLFGLLFLLAKELPEKAKELSDRLKKILGREFASRKDNADKMSEDLLFEAEAFFGSDSAIWSRYVDELIINFEQDLINEELVQTMQELKIAENSQDMNKLNELIKKSQVLSVRKREINNKRR